jgi:hypothetical protein
LRVDSGESRQVARLGQPRKTLQVEKADARTRTADPFKIRRAAVAAEDPDDKDVDPA